MYTFKKEERLYKRKNIEALFSKGAFFFSFPFKIIWLETEKQQDFPAKLLISVPKRNFKRAVDRNRVKRLIREAYRKNKGLLYGALEFQNKYLNFAIIYTQKEIFSYQEIESSIIVMLEKLNKAYEKLTD